MRNVECKHGGRVACRRKKFEPAFAHAAMWPGNTFPDWPGKNGIDLPRSRGELLSVYGNKQDSYAERWRCQCFLHRDPSQEYPFMVLAVAIFLLQFQAVPAAVPAAITDSLVRSVSTRADRTPAKLPD